ncbi:MAG: methylmalonyl-CoA mutase, partial [Streptosporangiaceae bacterium]|nr:methylmalonyl-CoA mutase [Streptosporangiaceae bacterium]
QQVLMEETGVANVIDPLGGSWYVEALTDKVEAAAEEIFARIRAMSPDGSMTGGILRGIADGWFTGEIADAAFAYQQKLEKGEKKIVGVNSHLQTVAAPVEILRVSPEVERSQVALLARRRAGRDGAAVDAALAAMIEAARNGSNMVPPMLDAARAEATLGEICGALRAEWGAYAEQPAF